MVSSDGLQYLEDDKIQRILHRYRRKKAAEIAGYLLEAIEALADPDQDNCTFSVIKLNHNKPVIRAIRAKPVGHVDRDTSTVTRVVELEDLDKVAAKVVEKASQPVSVKESTTIKEVKPIRTVKVHNNTSDTEEVDAAEPPAKIAAGGK